MITFPTAKINLGLNVVERRADGYHNLQTVFYPVPIQDRIMLSDFHEDSTFTGDCELIIENLKIDGDPQDNLVVRAYKLLKEDFPTLPRVHVHLFKAIPTQAGMGGGSSDGAYMIRMLNQQYRLGLTEQRMTDYAARLGADCAFFIQDRPCYAEGIGERLQPIGLNLCGWYICVVKPDIPVPTREAFSRIRPHYPTVNCREAVLQPVEEWRHLLANDFEESVFALHPEIAAVKEKLYQAGATYASMSGSGSAVYALFRKAPETLFDDFPDCFTFWCRLNDVTKHSMTRQYCCEPWFHSTADA